MSLDLPSPTPAGSSGSSGPAATGSAPDAPGRLGGTVTPQEAFGFLRDLGVWRDRRKNELDGLDSAALASSERDSFSRDMLVSMALWKAISDRYDLLAVTFDSGRVGPSEAQKIAALIWGRLDVAPGSAAGVIAPSTSGALALSLPEACRLSDAMTSSLRARLSLEPSGAEVGTRLKDVRETVERIRDQVVIVPPTEREATRRLVQRLDQRLIDVTERARRGADVGGLLAPLEYDASTLERDLIVEAGQRLDAARDAARATQLRTELAARGGAIHLLEDQAVAAVTPAPRLAIPDVMALGEVPTTRQALEAYLGRLDAVGRALTRAHAAYADALAERDEAHGLVGALGAQARAAGIPVGLLADLEELSARLERAFAASPTDMARVRALTAAFQTYLRTATAGPPGRP
ncbi:hypothetical protein [Lapillicoccus sp.]|uniref:hypothetical protein n=1 Tax=Lapillicoccus sp. TaxID=1909287 RepID=UPI0025CECBD8|nr:hypothetical protein [Lapillicoccus sp.]